MKKLGEGRAFLVAFMVSSVVLVTTLGSAFGLRSVWSGKQFRVIKPPIVNEEIVSRGRQIFVKHCVECHGFDARGEEGPDLRKIHAGDKLVRQVIIGGIKGEMPAYGKSLSEAETQALTAYLRTLRN